MFNISWLSMLLIGLFLTQIIIFLVTIYFHRSVSHRAVILSPLMHKICRFLSWFLIAMDPQEFAAVHRKHHAKVDTDEDPHTPVKYGVLNVLFGGLPLYRKAAKNPDVIKKYGHGMVKDKWENFYKKYPNTGILLSGLLMTGMFGLKGVFLWIITLIWIPFWAAGVINGLGHYMGYRRFSTPDASTNLIPFGIWIGGEELHNNHHAMPTSAKFSQAWYEIDIGWYVICLLKWLNLAEIKKQGKWVKRNNAVLDSITVKHLITQKVHWLSEWHKAASKDMKKSLKEYGFNHWPSFAKKLSKDCPKAKKFAEEETTRMLLKYEKAWHEWMNERHKNADMALEKMKKIWVDCVDLELPNIQKWCHSVAKMEFSY